MSTEVYDAIVCGAGVSGLAAAYNIKKRNPDAKVLVLEAKDRVGGRTQALELKAASGTDKWDLGGQWVATSQIYVMNLIKELGLETYKQYNDGMNIIQVCGDKSKRYKGEIPSISICGLLDMGWNMYITNKRAHEIDIYDPMSHPNAEYWDSISVDEYFRTSLYTQEAYEAMAGFIRALFGLEANQCSCLYFLYYTQLAGTLEKLIGDHDDMAQSIKIKTGAHSISHALVSRIGEQNVKLSEPVVAVSQDDSCVTVTTKSGWTGKTKRIIMAMPPRLMERIEFSPKLPQDRMDFMRRMPMGNYFKAIITYEKAFWRDKGFSGMGSSSGLPRLSNGLEAPINFWFDATTYNGNPAVAIFISGQMAIDWMMKPAEERKRAVLDHLVFLYEDKNFASPLHYEEKNWNHEPYSDGCPASVLSTGAMANFAKSIRRVEGRIHFAGTETALCWSGYMDGAVQAGERAGLEVLSHISPKSLSDKDRAQLEHDRKRFESIGKNKKKSKGFFKTVLYTSVGVAILAGVFYAVLTYLDVEVGKLISMP